MKCTWLLVHAQCWHYNCGHQDGQVKASEGRRAQKELFDQRYSITPRHQMLFVISARLSRWPHTQSPSWSELFDSASKHGFQLLPKFARPDQFISRLGYTHFTVQCLIAFGVVQFASRRPLSRLGDQRVSIINSKNCNLVVCVAVLILLVPIGLSL